MTEGMSVEELREVVIRFSGDSGDGMQLAGNIFSTISATEGNGISTFPDYPADIRAPQGSLTGVSGYQVHIGNDVDKVLTPGDRCDVLVAMNAAALKTQIKFAKPTATIIIDTNSFKETDLKEGRIQELRLPRGARHRPRPRRGLSADEYGQGGSEGLGTEHEGHSQEPEHVRLRGRMLALQPQSRTRKRSSCAINSPRNRR